MPMRPASLSLVSTTTAANSQPTDPGAVAVRPSSVDNLYSVADETDTDDEWFNAPDPPAATKRKPVPGTLIAAGLSGPSTVNHEDAWDQQPDSGPLLAPSACHPQQDVAVSSRYAARDYLPPASPPSSGAVVGKGGDLPPAYVQRVEERPRLSRSSTNSSDVSDSSLPPYETAARASSTSPTTAPGFHPTRHLQIETKGIGMIRLPMLPPRSEPVLIRAASHDGVLGSAVYKSLQSSRTSGSCVLVDAETDFPLCTTKYAPGPVRPPKLCLVQRASGTVVTPEEAGKFMKFKPPYDAELIGVEGDEVGSRACSIRTSHGHFRWRYGKCDEKREAKGPIMVFEKIRETTLANGKKQETRRRIGQLLRSEAMRTAGSTGTSAGNGGRLMLDLNEWADQKEVARAIEVFATASCLVMLRKEMNQRRLRQGAVMATVGAIL